MELIIVIKGRGKYKYNGDRNNSYKDDVVYERMSFGGKDIFNYGYN